MSKPCKYGTRRDENGERKCAITCKRRGKKYARGMDGQCSPKDLQIIVYDLANAEPALSDDELRRQMTVEFGTLGIPDAEIPQVIEEKIKKIKKLRKGTYKTKQRPAITSRGQWHKKVEDAAERIRRGFIQKEKAARPELPWGFDEDQEFKSSDDRFNRSNEKKNAVGYKGEDPAISPAAIKRDVSRSSVSQLSNRFSMHSSSGDSLDYDPIGRKAVSHGSAAEVLARKKETRKARLGMLTKDFNTYIAKAPSSPKTLKCPAPNIEYFYKKNKTPVCAPPCGENEAAHWEKQENGKYAPVCRPNCSKEKTRVNGKGVCVATEGSCKAAGLGYSKTRKACKEPNAQPAQLDGNKRKQAAPKKAVPQTFIENEEEDAMGYDQLIAMGMAPMVARNLNSLTFIEIIKDPTIENPLDKNPELKNDMIGHLIKEKVYSAKQNPEDFSNSKIIQDYIDAFDFELEDHPMKKIFDFFEKHTAEEFENETQKKNWIKEFWKKETGDILENITDEEYEKIKERIQEKKKVLERRIQEKKDQVKAAPVQSESESENDLIDMPNEYLKPGDYAYTNEDRTCGKVVQMYEEETELNKAFNLDLDEDLINVGDSVVVLNNNQGYRRYGIIERIEYLHPEDEDDPGEVSLKMFRVNNYQPILPVDIALFPKKMFGEIIKHPKHDVSLMFLKEKPMTSKFRDELRFAGLAEVAQIIYEGNASVSAAHVVKLIHSVYKMPFSPSIVLDTVDYALGWDQVTSSTAFFVNNQYVINLNGGEVEGTLLSKKECTGTFRTEKGEVAVPFCDVVDLVKGAKRNKPVNKELQTSYNQYLKAYLPNEAPQTNDLEPELDEDEVEPVPKKKKEVYLLDNPKEEDVNKDETLAAKIAALPDRAEMKEGLADFISKRFGAPKPAPKPLVAPKMSLVDRLAKLKAAKVTQASPGAAAS